MVDGLCRQVDNGDLWFGEAGENQNEAIRVCRMCPVQQPCLEYAIANQEKWGVWGGKSVRARQDMRRQRNRRTA